MRDPEVARRELVESARQAIADALAGCCEPRALCDHHRGYVNDLLRLTARDLSALDG